MVKICLFIVSFREYEKWKKEKCIKELKINAECSKQGNNLCLKVFHEENRKIKSQLVIKSITKYEKKKFNDNIQYVLDQICGRKKKFFRFALETKFAIEMELTLTKMFLLHNSVRLF